MRGQTYKGESFPTLDKNKTGPRRARVLANFAPQGGWQILPWYDCIAFAPCNCVAYFFNAIPVAPVERSFNLVRGHNVARGREYRCLICAIRWDDDWLERRRLEVYKGMA